MKRLTKFVPLMKYDAAKGEGEGVLALEEIDTSGEIMDYMTSKPNFEAWSADVYAKSGGKSKGNLRRQHDPQKAVGKLTDLEFDDAVRAVRVRFKVTDPLTKSDCAEGVLTGLSIGGFYERTWEDESGFLRYTARPIEASVVDRPAMPNATFVFKAESGEEEQRKFSNVRQIRQVWDCGWDDCAEIHVAKADATRCSGFAKTEKEIRPMDETQMGDAVAAEEPAAPVADAPVADDPIEVVIEEPAATADDATPPETAGNAPASADPAPVEPTVEATAESGVADERAATPAEAETIAAAAEGDDLAKAAEPLAKAVAELAEAAKANATRIDGIERALAELTALLTKAVEKPSAATQRPAVAVTSADPATAKAESVDDLVKAALAEPRPVFLSR